MKQQFGIIAGFNIDRAAIRYKKAPKHLYNLWKLQGFKCFVCKKDGKTIEIHQNSNSTVLVCRSCVMVIKNRMAEQRGNDIKTEVEEEFEQESAWEQTIGKII